MPLNSAASVRRDDPTRVKATGPSGKPVNKAQSGSATALAVYGLVSGTVALGSAKLAGVGVDRLDANDAWLTRLVEIAVAIGVAVVAGCLADFVLAFAGGRLGRRRWIGVDDRSRS